MGVKSFIQLKKQKKILEEQMEKDNKELVRKSIKILKTLPNEITFTVKKFDGSHPVITEHISPDKITIKNIEYIRLNSEGVIKVMSFMLEQ